MKSDIDNVFDKVNDYMTVFEKFETKASQLINSFNTKLLKRLKRKNRYYHEIFYIDVFEESKSPVKGYFSFNRRYRLLSRDEKGFSELNSRYKSLLSKLKDSMINL